MTTLIRTTVAALAVALAVAGSAAASSALVVKTSQLVRNASSATITTREDPGTYRTTVFAPAAYRLPYRALGTQFGSALVHVSTPAGPLEFHGWLVGENPLDFTNDECASFAGDEHLAVWMMELRQVNGIARAEIPVYVDAGPGGQTELTWCASSAADMTVTGVSLGLGDTFLNPIVPGAYTWRAGFDNVTSGDRTVLGDVTTSASATVRVHA